MVNRRLALIVGRALRHSAEVALAVAVVGGLLAWGPHTARAQNGPTGYSITFVARWCNDYSDVYATRRRDDLSESLKPVGPDSPYGPYFDAIPGVQQVLPSVEDNPDGSQALAPPYGTNPNGPCHPLPGWKFTMGTAKLPRNMVPTGPWGALSILTDQHFGSNLPNVIFPTPVVTQDSTPLLDQHGQEVKNGNGQVVTIPGAVTIPLSEEELSWSQGTGENGKGIQCGPWAQGLPADVCMGWLWVQGGTPEDPALAQTFHGTDGSPTYGFAALRCVTDNNSGDNVDWAVFLQGTQHGFCYAYYVKPSPDAGTITIKKNVTGDIPNNDNPKFPFTGTLPYDPAGFELANGESHDFPRAGGTPAAPLSWTVTEGDEVGGFHLVSVDCNAVTEAGGPGQSTASISGPTAVIHLVAGEHVTCVYTNEAGPQPGGLTITKITRGGTGAFGYEVTGGGATHRVTATTHQENVPVDAAPSLTGQLPDGRYQIREARPTSPDGVWRLLSVVCNGVTEPSTGPVEVTVSQGVATVCTFTNVFHPRGSISIGKITHGATGTARFVVSGPNSTVLSPVSGLALSSLDRKLSATTKSQGVEARAEPFVPELDSTASLRLGRYRISEMAMPGTPANGWSLTGVTCNGVQVPFSQGTIEVKLTKSERNLHCVFTDTFTEKPPVTPPPDPGPDDKPAQQTADLSVTKRASPTVVRVGDTVTFRITVTNHGPDHATRVMLHDELSAPGDLVGINTDTGSCAQSLPVTCELGTLAPNAKAEVTVRLRITSPASPFTDRAVVGAETPDPTTTNNVDAAAVRVTRPATPRPPTAKPKPPTKRPPRPRPSPRPPVPHVTG